MADQPRLTSDGDAEVDHAAAHLAKGKRRPPDTIWRANPREQGLIGFTDAIHFFGSLGWSINVPLIDSQPYDLVVDDGGSLHRVQVKTTTYRGKSGTFVVQVCTNGGNQSYTTAKLFDPSAYELLYVLTDDTQRYLIPARAVQVSRALTLGRRMTPYRVPGPGRLPPAFAGS